MPTTRRSRRAALWFALALAATLAVSACAQPTPTPVPTVLATNTPVAPPPATHTPQPTLPLPTATATVAATSEPTVAPTGGEGDEDVVEAWEGVIVKLAPGSQFGQFFQRADGERYDLGSTDDAVAAQLLDARWTGARIRVWGRVSYGVPATEARHIEVERVEALTGPATEARNLAPFATASASSTLPADAGGSYYAGAAIDGLLETAWVEGAAESGAGEWLRLEFPGTILIERLAIDVGYDKDAALFAANNRVRLVTLDFSGGESLQIELADMRGPQSVFVDGISASWVQVTIRQVYAGASANDTCMAEIEVWGVTQ